MVKVRADRKQEMTHAHTVIIKLVGPATKKGFGKSVPRFLKAIKPGYAAMTAAQHALIHGRRRNADAGASGDEDGDDPDEDTTPTESGDADTKAGEEGSADTEATAGDGVHTALKVLFDTLDTNKNGVVEKGEILSVLRNPDNATVELIRGVAALAGLLKPQHYAATLNAMDTNKDGSMQFEELVSFCAKVDVDGNIETKAAAADENENADADADTKVGAGIDAVSKTDPPGDEDTKTSEGGDAAEVKTGDVGGNEGKEGGGETKQAAAPQPSAMIRKMEREQKEKEALDSKVPSAVERMFRILDEDSSGSIEKKELLKVVRENVELREMMEESELLQPLLKPKAFAQCFDRIDETEDGVVSLDEFRTFMVDLLDHSAKEEVDKAYDVEFFVEQCEGEFKRKYLDAEFERRERVYVERTMIY
jgi:Ca2+-binding EF-hand superfamily protein